MKKNRLFCKRIMVVEFLFCTFFFSGCSIERPAKEIEARFETTLETMSSQMAKELYSAVYGEKLASYYGLDTEQIKNEGTEDEKSPSKDRPDNSVDIGPGKIEGLEKQNGYITDSEKKILTPINSEKDVEKEIFTLSEKYSEFSVLAAEEDYVHIAEWYMRRYPEIISMTINMEKSKIYKNGVYIRFENVKTIQDQFVSYTIRTGDESFLENGSKEWAIYSMLGQLSEQIDLENTTDIEKVKRIHDTLIYMTNYDFETAKNDDNLSDAHSPYGLLHNGLAVCDGYARTFKLLSQMNGIESKVTTGKGKDEAHAWNLVHIEDDWYELDVTWDDTLNPDKVSYDYFMRTDEDFCSDHDRSTDKNNQNIKCTSDKYEMYPYEQFVCYTEKEAKQVYEAQKDNNSIVFVYPKDGIVSDDKLRNMVMIDKRKGISYRNAKPVGDFLVLEIINPDK